MGCFNLLALRTILNIGMTGQRLGLALSEDKIIVWPFWQLFWMHDVILTDLEMQKKRIIVNLQLALRLVKEGKILCSKCCYDLVARWVNMVIDL